MTASQLRAAVEAWHLGGSSAELNHLLRGAAPQLLALWEAAEAERDARCWSRSPYDHHDACVCGTFESAIGCPVTLAHDAVAAVLAMGLS